jgi:hypothetical protein
VAIEERGKCLPILPVIPETPEEKRRYDEALERRKYRLEQRKKGSIPS